MYSGYSIHEDDMQHGFEHTHLSTIKTYRDPIPSMDRYVLGLYVLCNVDERLGRVMPCCTADVQTAKKILDKPFPR